MKTIPHDFFPAHARDDPAAGNDRGELGHQGNGRADAVSLERCGFLSLQSDDFLKLIPFDSPHCAKSFNAALLLLIFGLTHLCYDCYVN